MSYTHLAAVYDRLMADTPYDAWLRWLGEVWEKVGKPSSIIDLGCGTGNLSIPLAKQGYTVYGVDLSADMLAVAYEKMKQEQVRVTWIEQDMRELDVQPVDAVISCCDSPSYLLEEDDVKRMFQRVFAHLKPGGHFLFDVHSPYKIVNVYGDNTFTLDEPEIAYIWQCFTDPLRFEVEHQLTFFIHEQNGCYRRLEEVHVQRAYHALSLEKWLRDAGFVDVVVTADFQDLPPQKKSERLFFTARRP